MFQLIERIHSPNAPGPPGRTAASLPRVVTEDWHTWQDRQAEEVAIARAREVMSSPDAVLRTWYWAGFD